MRIVYSLPALRDLEHVSDYIAMHSRRSANRVANRIASVISSLVAHPSLGQQTDDPSIRRLNARPYPYLIFYEVLGEEIVVLAVRHGARDPSSMPGTDRDPT